MGLSSKMVFLVVDDSKISRKWLIEMFPKKILENAEMIEGSNGEEAIALYEEMIANQVCTEQARLVLPQGCMVNWVWTGNVMAFANMFNKRIDPHAQKEVQDLALAIQEVVEPLFPISWKALTRTDLGA